MADRDDHYFRQQAEEAQQQAERSISDLDRASWLRIAQSWLRLIKGDKASPEQAFDECERKQGTRQDVSKEPQ
jgi:hypothetical protein